MNSIHGRKNRTNYALHRRKRSASSLAPRAAGAPVEGAIRVHAARVRAHRANCHASLKQDEARRGLVLALLRRKVILGPPNHLVVVVVLLGALADRANCHASLKQGEARRALVLALFRRKVILGPPDHVVVVVILGALADHRSLGLERQGDWKGKEQREWPSEE